MKIVAILTALLISFNLGAQNPEVLSPFDNRSWGNVLDHPDMKNVIVKKDISYLKDAAGNLKIDIYSPPILKSGEKRSAIIFLNGAGDAPSQLKMKDWEIYKTWLKLMAANGFIGISMEADGSRVQECIQGIFRFLSDKVPATILMQIN